MLPVLSRIALQSLAAFCLIKHRTSSTFLQQTSYIYIAAVSLSLVWQVHENWQTEDGFQSKHVWTEQVQLSSTHCHLQDTLSLHLPWILRVLLKSSLLLQHRSLHKYALDFHTELCWLVSGSEVNCCPILFSLCVVTPTHYKWAFIHYYRVPVSAKRFLFAVWVVGFARWEKDSPATKQTDTEILQKSLSVQPNIKIHLVPWG